MYPGQRSVEILFSVPGKYMAVDCLENRVETDSVAAENAVSFLCDLQGNILYPEWEYDFVTYPKDQYGRYERGIIEFAYMTDEDEAMKSSRFLDVASGEEIILPDGYECARFMRDGYFLLSRKNEYAIYDVSTQAITRTFTIEGDAFAGTIYVLGSDGYIVQDPFGGADGNQVVIEGKTVKMKDSATVGYLLPGEYQVVKIGTLLDTSVEKAYILNPDGQMLLETKEDVIYADEEGYLIWDVTGKYQIQSYKTQVPG